MISLLPKTHLLFYGWGNWHLFLSYAFLPVWLLRIAEKKLSSLNPWNKCPTHSFINAYVICYQTPVPHSLKKSARYCSSFTLAQINAKDLKYQWHNSSFVLAYQNDPYEYRLEKDRDHVEKKAVLTVGVLWWPFVHPTIQTQLPLKVFVAL